MEELKAQLTNFLSDRLYRVIISNPVKKEDISKIIIHPVMLKKRLLFQETQYRGTQVFHENYEAKPMLEKITEYLRGDFKQLEAEGMDGKLTAMVSKKGKVTTKMQKADKTKVSDMPKLSHNRTKNYILEEGIPVPFLIDLGVQTPEGRVVLSKYDKFKQINRYLEFVEDILPALYQEEPIHIIDFGCGKSYLTFALYYFLHVKKGLEVMITGLDLKEDVISHCSELAVKYGYTGLRFLKGDISTFEGTQQVDMVVTLHACDTATDYAIYKAIEWNARVIFTVPCCQHEVNKQIKNEVLRPVLKYGLLKERMAALITDGIRANILEEAGYETQILEFIDMEHTPKNILIRAIRASDRKTATKERTGIDTGIEELTRVLQIENTLQKLTGQK